MIERESLQELLAAACGLDRIALEPSLGREWVASVSPEAVPDAVRALCSLPEWRHLSTITGQALGDAIELLYHCWLDQGVTLRVTLPLTLAEVPSLTPLLPGAGWYEREVQELFGVTFGGLADMPPVLYSEVWDPDPSAANREERP